MRVTVELYGELKKYGQDHEKSLKVEISDGSSVGELMAKLGFPQTESWNAAINGEVVYPEDRLSDGASIIVFPPISGG